MSSEKPRHNREAGLRLAYLRKKAGLTQAEIGDILGLTGESISKMERGAVALSAERAEILAEKLESTPAWILWGDMEHGGDAPGQEQAREIGPIYRVGEDYLLPVIGRVLADDTGGRLVDVANALGWFKISGNACMAQVLGASLAPVARPGQHLLMDSAERSAREGDLVVIETNDGRVLGKRLHENGDMLVLQSVNPADTQPPIRISKQDVKGVHVIIGVLFE